MARITTVNTSTSTVAGVDLRALAQAAQSATDAQTLGNIVYQALLKIQASSATQDRRLRDMAQPLANDPNIPQKLLVNGDRLQGALQIEGLLSNPVGQSLDIEFGVLPSGAGPAGFITCRDHQNSQNLPLVITAGSLIAPMQPTNLFTTYQGLAYNSVVQSIPNSAWTTLTFDTNYYSAPPTIHSTTVNTSRFTANSGGDWLTMGNVMFAASGAGGLRGLRVLVNGATTTPGIYSYSAPSSTFQTTASVAVWGNLNPNDYVEFQAFQDSGGALNTVALDYYGSIRFISSS